MRFTDVIVHSTIHNMETAIKLANMTEKMSNYAKNAVRNLDPANDLLVLRMGTKHHEIIVAHGTFYYTFSILSIFLKIF